MGSVDYQRLKNDLERWDAQLKSDPAAGHPHASVSSRHIENLRSACEWQEFGKTFRFETDEANQRGGDDSAPSPLRYFLAGLVFCQQVFYSKGAALVGCTMDDVQIDAESYFDMRGEFTLPRDTSVEAGLQWIVLTSYVSSKDSSETVLAAVDEANARCPVVNTIRKGIPVYERVIHNGALIRDSAPPHLSAVPASPIP